MPSSLLKLWEAQFDNSDDQQLAKEASAHGMSSEQYIEKLAELKMVQEEEMQKAAKDRFAYGEILGEGIKKGIAGTLSKLAAAGGDVYSAEKLRKLFCEG